MLMRHATRQPQLGHAAGLVRTYHIGTQQQYVDCSCTERWAGFLLNHARSRHSSCHDQEHPEALEGTVLRMMLNPTGLRI